MDSSPIGSALILAGARIFGRPGEPSPASPLTAVSGLSLFQRAFLTLQRGGISRFVVLAGDETEALKRQLRGDARFRFRVRWLPIREFPPGDPRTWEVLSSVFGGPYLVAATGAVFPVSLVARVREAGGNGEPVVVVRDAGLAAIRTIAPPVQMTGRTSGGGVATVEKASAFLLDVDLAAVPSAFVSPEGVGAQEGEYPLRAAVERGIRRGQVRVLPLGEDWYQEVCAEGPATRAQAEWTLLKDGLDRFVGRHFNRPCPQWITRLLRQIVHLLR
jgi:hypothetical protein